MKKHIILNMTKLMLISFIFLWLNQSIAAQTAQDNPVVENDSIALIYVQAEEPKLPEAYKPNQPQIIPSSPQSQIFEKYLNHEISEYNGLPQIEIPLYEIKIKGLTIPITLSYHAGGIKYRQYDGEVGAGWSLNVGGYRVSRTVKGKTDEDTEFYSHDYYNEVVQNARSGDYAKKLIKDTYLAGMNGWRYNTENFLYEDRTNYLDSQYDDFIYMLPSSSGQFIITDRNVITNAIENITLGDSRDQIFLNIENNDAPLNRLHHNSLNSIEIRDENGFIYNLGGKLPDGSFLIEMSDPLQEIVYSTAWPLNRILSPFNDKIEFSYKKIGTGSEKYNNNPYLNIVQPECTDYSPGGSYSPQTFDNRFPKNISLSSFYSSMFFIDTIKTENIKIIFERDDQVEHQLKRILIQDYNGEVKKQVKFDYEKKLFHDLLSSIKFGNISEDEKEYNFSYYDGPNVAEDRIYPDQWGYYSSQIAHPVFTTKNIYNRDATYHSELGKLKIQTYGANLGAHQLNPGDFRPLEDALQDSYARFGDKKTVKVVPDFFSLKTISFPTGGYTEFQYESHEYKSESLEEDIKGGGLRIKTIISRPDTESPETITRYKYGKNEDGLGYPNVDLIWRDFVDNSLTFRHVDEWIAGAAVHTTIRGTGGLLCSTSSLLPEGSNVKIQYDEVHKYQFPAEHVNFKEKTISKFKIENEYVFWNYPENDYQGPHIKKYSGLLNSGITAWRKQVKEYRPTSKPRLDSREIYNREGKIIQKEKYNYIKKNNLEYSGVKTFKAVSGNVEKQERILSVLYQYTDSYFAHFPYTIKSYAELLDEKIITDYTHIGIDSIPTSIKEKYYYNSQNQLTKKTIISSGNAEVTTEYKYPADFIGENNVYKIMVENNIIAPIIEQTTKHGNSLVGKIKTEYSNNQDVTNGFILPSAIMAATTDDNYRTELTYDKYDIKGNPLQITDINGIRTSYLWSYNYQYPIAEITNGQYADININTTEIAKSRHPNMDEVNKLRSTSSLSGSLINTYEYEEFRGIKKHTNPRSISTNYGYDKFGRFSSIKDNNDYLIEEYKYNYNPVPMLMLTMNLKEEYIINSRADISVNVANGSNDYIYSWILSDTDGNVISNIENGTNTFITPIFTKVDMMVITCNVHDKILNQKTSIKRTFNVTHLPVKIDVYDVATGKYPDKYHLLSENPSENIKTLKVVPKNGSGNYSYEWFLAYSQTGTKFKYGYSDTFEIKLDEKKGYEIFCKVTDIETKRSDTYSTNIVVANQLIEFEKAYDPSGVGKIILKEGAKIKLRLLFNVKDADPMKELKVPVWIEGKLYQLSRSDYGRAQFIDLHIGVDNKIYINSPDYGSNPGAKVEITIYEILENGIPGSILTFSRSF